MCITVFMTLPQANLFKLDCIFSDGFIHYKGPTAIHAHYISIPSLEWDGWDNVTSITKHRRNQLQLTYEQFTSIPKPITVDYFKSTYPELFI